ncbi:MAG: sodium:solute symporter family protein [Flammeovirgaceae bacterium]|nr:sodium:solute symporter family protein [Flammeovirgaceae bacterium]
MIPILIVISIIYLGLLITFSLVTRQKEKDTATYLLAGSKIGSVLGIFTFAATLFSTFTLIGMPDFFRTHGVGSWMFLAFSDAAMVFAIISVGYYLRKKAKREDFKGLSGLIAQCYKNKFAGYIIFAGAFVFLVPYVAIQIRGIAIFLNATFPGAMPIWGWASAMVVIMLTYSEIGGLKAIIYSDMLQGLLLLIVIWIIGYNCLSYFGNLDNLFIKIEEVNKDLLSIPGPKGLFTPQFLIASFIAIMMIPFTQPQVVTRIIIMKNYKSLFRMAIGVGVFAMIIIFPTLLIGMYGAIHYPEASTADFISNVLISEQSDFIAAFTVIGLIAAAISTSDSQIFAMGGELRSLLEGEDAKMLQITRIAIVFFAVTILVFSLLTSDQLVLLARTSFAGTALMAPMIFTGIFATKKLKMGLPIFTLVCMLTFIASLMGLIPNNYLGIRLDLILMFSLVLFALVNYHFFSEKTVPEQVISEAK